ncbi:TonB-dependent receptor [Gloeobacter kilaueensis]|uniref:TonB-dependent receptor n=1 Tax=Gloeobacter kilaueensis (strain ATCC BAA-2537 / CCAP 1431/1 / ULC 316 / JS1) TaxID=1183438 RepID=U5QN07_GLOK1|nr:TonB-dependent receptor [Gloeobacter kilaueensis]AGY59060.1 TonB-dependent receptor [Gloeobacter kilaueensis JS1]
MRWVAVVFLLLAIEGEAVLAEPGLVLTRRALAKQEADIQTVAQALEPGNPTSPAGGISLDEVVVTANRRPTAIKETTSTVYVVDRKEIERKDAVNVGEAIRGVPGVQANVFGAGADVHNNFFVRGLPNLGVGVLVDGRLITSINQEHFDLADLPVYNVERIEVLTGSGTTLYGSNAAGGIINVITRKPTGPLEGDIKVEFGSYGFSNYILNYGGKLDKFGFHLGYRQFDASNDYYYQVQRPTGLFTGFRPNGDVHQKFYDLNLSYDFDDRNRLRFDGYLRGGDRGLAPFSIIDPSRPLVNDEGEPQFELTRLNTQSHGLALTYDADLGQGNDSHLQVTAAIDRNLVVERETFDPTDLGEYTDVSIFNFSIRHDWQFNPSNNLTYGFDYIREFGRSGENAAGGLFNFDTGASRPALFALYTWKVASNLIMTVGARETIPDNLQAKGLNRALTSSFDPSAGIRWQITPTLALRANYARIYRIPNFNDLFGRTTHIGNPFLEPETGNSYDVGLDWQTGNTSLLRLTYFRQEVDNLTDYLLVRNACNLNGNAPDCNDDPASNAERFRVNYPRIDVSGWELAYNWQISPVLNVFATGTVTDSRIIQAPNPATIDAQLQQLGIINNSDEGTFRVDVAERNALVQTQYPLVPFLTTRFGLNYESPTGFAASLFVNLSGGRSVDVNHVGPFDTTHPARLPPGSLLPGYTTLDLSLRVPIARTIVLNAFIDNLLGTYYERSYGNAAPGFNFRVGLSTSF